MGTSKHKKLMTHGLVLILGMIIGVFAANLWCRAGWKNRELVAKVIEGNNVYYQAMKRQSAIQKEGYKEILTELSRYEEKTIAYTYYDEKEGECYVVLDFYFSDAEQLRGKRELFLKFDEGLEWSSDNATIELWVFEDDAYTRKDDLSFINAGVLSEGIYAGIYIRDLGEQFLFPLHIRVKLTASWTEEKMPEKIMFEYGLW